MGNKMSSLVYRQSLHTKRRPTVSIWGAIRGLAVFFGSPRSRPCLDCPPINWLSLPISEIQGLEFIEANNVVFAFADV